MKTIVNEIKALNFLEIISMSKDSSFFSSNDFRASMLVSVIETLCGFINVDEGFNFFPEIFTLASKLLNQLAGQDHTPVALRDKSKDVSGFIEKKIKWYNQTRQPLQMRKRDPVPIKFSVPKFEDNYIKGRNYDPDCERAETKKTRKRIKEEAKGAIRELRKHNYFLAKAKAKDKAYLKKKRQRSTGRHELSFKKKSTP